MSLNNVEKFREKISKGQFCVGGCVSFSDPAISEMYGDLGYDFTWIDTEHCPLCLENVLGHIMAGRASGAAPFVRVPANDPILIKPLMDLQPAGIIIPMVNSAEEAKRAVAACKYPPKGIRGFGPRRGIGYGTMPVKEYLEKADDETIVIIQCESIDAVNDIDAILEVDGVDSICLGPMDMSGSMGILAQSNHPDLQKAVATVADKVSKSDKILGIATGYNAGDNGAFIKKLFDKGLQWVCVNTDFVNLAGYSKQVLENVKSIT